MSRRWLLAHPANPATVFRRSVPTNQGAIRSGLVIVFLVLTSVAGTGQDVDDTTLATLQQRAVETEAARAAIEPAQLARREQIQVWERQRNQLRLQISRLELQVKDLEAKLPPLDTAQQAAAAVVVQREQAVAAAKAAVEAALGTDGEAAARQAADQVTAQLTEAQTALTTADKQLATIKEPLVTAKARLSEHSSARQTLEDQIAALQPELQAGEQQLAALTNEAITALRAVEDVLIARGQRVSFARHVAPILATRCVACHNTRTAKGRLNLETVQQLQKGGETGPAVVPGDLAASELWTQIAEGLMPKDADLLSPSDVEIIRRWIESGAPYDAGLNRQAPLISIAPKPVQPAPPAVYVRPAPVLAAAISPDGTRLVTSGYRELLVWNLADGSLVQRLSNLAERPHDIQYSPDGSLIAVAAGTPAQLGEVKLYQVTDGALIGDLVTTDDEVLAVAFRPDGLQLAAAGADRAIRILDVVTKRPIRQIDDHADWVLDVAWSPDGTQLASASRDKTAKVFAAATGELLATFNLHQQPVYSVGFVTVGNELASAGADLRVRVWQVAEAKQLREIGGFGGIPFRLLMLPGGEALTASADHHARWHNLTNGQGVKQLGPHSDWLYAIAYHAASRRIVTGSHDGEVRVWNADDPSTPLLKFVAVPPAAASPPATAATTP